MRIHGIGDVIGDDDDDLAGEWEEKIHEKVFRPINKRPMYALRTNPNRLKTCRICENCGQEFLSWKSFLGHGKCTSDDAESLVSSPDSDDDNDREHGNEWYKRRRSIRLKVDNFSPNCPSSEEEELAYCLMMLSKANAADRFFAEHEESCASASKEDDRRNPMIRRRNMINYLSPISGRIPREIVKSKSISSKGIFECKACKKVFKSHQALGGHRASHKKVKGCFAAKLDQTEDSLENDDVITQEDHQFIFSTKSNSSLQLFNGGTITSDPPLMASTSKKKTKIHECSICHRIFATGQALGGHKRCHWITSSAAENLTPAKNDHLQDQMEKINNNNNNNARVSLDLNFPVPAYERVSIPENIPVSTSIYLQSWIKGKEKEEEEDDSQYYQRHLCRNYDDEAMIQKVDNETDSEVKLAKLGELKHKNINGGSSPWLQMGIGSTTDVGADPQFN